MPRATPANRKSNNLVPRNGEKVEETKLVKFELNYDNTRVLVESDNEKTLTDVLDVIRDVCGDTKALQKFLKKE